MNVITVPDHKVEELEQKITEGELPNLEAAMSYKLTDAMREGSSVTGQLAGWISPDGENMCALSAAKLALKARHMVS